jgi:hypothetical protein
VKIKTIFDQMNELMEDDLKKLIEKELKFTLVDSSKDYDKKMFFVGKYSELHHKRHGKDFFLF